MRKRRGKRLARTSVRSDKVLFFDKIDHPTTFKLSPFFRARFYLEGEWWQTVIHYYQAKKHENDADLFARIKEADSPEKAKQIGNSAYPDESWCENRYQIMKDATYAKFSQNKECSTYLISTGKKPLINVCPYDNYWSGKNYGENMMGKVLMEVRAELRKKLRMT
jgi:ribA/ribD-fused uncharacterized protein